MTAVNSILNQLFEILFLPFLNTGAWIPMIIISLLTGILMLVIFKYTSNQEGIRRTKNRIKAHLLEMRLYKDSFVTSLSAQGNILKANLRYMSHSLKPLLVMILPVILILIQLNFWFGYAPLQTEESTLLKIKLSDGYDPMEVDVKLELPAQLEMQTPALRIVEENEIDWRIASLEPGIHEAVITVGPQRLAKKIYAGDKAFMRISPLRPEPGFLQALLYPVEKPLPKDQPVRSIEVHHPAQGLKLFGMNIHWLIAFFALSIIFGFSLKGLFGVDI
jgi:uncharacterized membrane protein (DUF106 family)